MKKSLVVLAILSAAGASFAQTTVNVYGVVDAYYGSLRQTGTPTQNVMNSGGVDESRFGFKGTEDLGAGLKAIFLLEQGFATDSGGAGNSGNTFVPTANQAFSRQAYVGFSGDFGTVKLGKMFTAYDDISGVANAVFDSALAPVTNVWYSSKDASLAAPRAYAYNPGNSIYYASPSVGGFSGALSYSLGENKTANPDVDAGSVTSLRVQYDDGPLYVGVAHQTEKVTADVNSLNFTRLNATYDLGVVKVLAGYGRVSQKNNLTNQTEETDEWQVGVDYPVSSTLMLSGGVARSSDNHAKGDEVRNGYGLGASYSLSKRTAVYGGYQSSTQDTPNVSPETDRSLLAIGINHKF